MMPIVKKNDPIQTTFPLPKVDHAFKYIFGNPDNAPILQDFLEAVLGLSISDLEIESYDDPHLHRRSADDKLGILDLLVTLKDGSRVNIEIQIYYDKYILERSTYYASKLLSKQLYKGGQYHELRKVVSILILDDNSFDDEPYYHHFQILDQENGLVFNDLLQFHTLELKKLPAQSDNTKKYEWARFFSANTREELEMYATSDEYLADAYAELERLSQDPKAMDEYDRRLMAIMDEQSRMYSAHERGKDERNMEIAKSMKDAGTSIDFIMIHTGLSAAEIEKL